MILVPASGYYDDDNDNYNVNSNNNTNINNGGVDDSYENNANDINGGR